MEVWGLAHSLLKMYLDAIVFLVNSFPSQTRAMTPAMSNEIGTALVPVHHLNKFCTHDK